MHRISVVIPTYNRSARVGISIDSVLAQTFPATEIIVVDDGSKDDTQAVLAKYGDLIRTIVQANAGPAEARNTGIRAATSEWIAFLDDDDIFTPDRLEIAVESMRRHPDAKVHLSNLAIVPDNKPEFELFALRKLKASEYMLLDRPLSWCLQGCAFVQTLVIRRETIIASGLFKKIFYEDLEFILRLSAHTPWTVDRRCSVRLSRRIGETLSVSAHWKTKPIENYETQVKIYGDLRKRGSLNSEEHYLAEICYFTYLYELGRVYYMHGRTTQARECFRECVHSAPRFSTRLKSRAPLMLGRTGVTLVERWSSRRKIRST